LTVRIGGAREKGTWSFLQSPNTWSKTNNAEILGSNEQEKEVVWKEEATWVQETLSRKEGITSRSDSCRCAKSGRGAVAISLGSSLLSVCSLQHGQSLYVSTVAVPRWQKLPLEGNLHPGTTCAEGCLQKSFMDSSLRFAEFTLSPSTTLRVNFAEGFRMTWRYKYVAHPMEKFQER